MKKYTLKDIIKKSKLIHGDKYDYSKANFVNVKTKMVVICPIHGEFEITPDNHINGKSGCPKCGGVYNYTTQEWIDECNIKHKGRYDYSKTEYKNAKSKVKIICHEKDEFGVEHGEFEIRASNHIRGIGCPKCKYNIKIDIIKDVYDDINNVLGKIGINRNNNLFLNNFVIKYIDYSDVEDEAMINYQTLKKRGYYPIIIFPDEYHYKHEIVLNKIQHIIHYENVDKLPKIYARKCVIKEVTDYNEVKDFLEKNHLQSYVASTLYLGAYYNSKLVGVMSFLKEDKNSSWNLTRFATDNKYVCCGIGGKLFKYFTNHYEFNTIKSFADRRWTYDECNNIYTKLGFKLEGVINKDYRYYNIKVDKYQRYHKFNFRKELLHKKYDLPLSMTEREMTTKLNYKRIYDCGLFKYVFTKQ